MTTATAYLEHAAITVRDIGWHIRFFAEVFGMGCREVDGDPAAQAAPAASVAQALAIDPRAEA